MSPVLSTPSILRQLYKLLFKLHSALVLGCEKYNRDWTGVLKVHQAYGLQDTYSTKQNCLGESCLQKQVLSGLQRRFTCSGQRQWCVDIYTFYKSFSMSTGWANTTLAMVTLAAMNMLQWNRNFRSKTTLSLSYINSQAIIKSYDFTVHSFLFRNKNNGENLPYPGRS